VIDSQWIFTLATLLGAVGMWLLLPRATGRGRLVGAALVGLALVGWTLVTLGVGAWQIPLLGGWMGQGVFGMLAGVTLVAAIATVTMRNPVYCAIWFGMSLLGTAGLFLLAGAQFLAVATVVVYAGAILVTFLFVLMLARPRGRAAYDRVSWEALVSAALGMVMVGILSMTVSEVLTAEVLTAEVITDREGPDPTLVVAQHARSQDVLRENVLAEEHVVHFSAELFGRHLIAIEVAGTLLLAALVGAAVIVGQSNRDHPEQPPTRSQ
jgi:NADH-quinone oxidoreductase subunit J